jgi:hypothetical protein
MLPEARVAVKGDKIETALAEIARAFEAARADLATRRD